MVQVLTEHNFSLYLHFNKQAVLGPVYMEVGDPR